MKKLIKYSVFFTCLIFFAEHLFAQESLKSTEEEYYDFLSLQGITERPSLGYRTLSDSSWEFEDTEDESINHPWQDLNLGKTRTLWENPNKSENFFTDGIKQGVYLKIYGPEWFNSFNTAAPYGQNDGALWQGKGYNTSLTGGARIEGYGFEATLKPQVTFSQNLEFEIMPGVYGSPYSYFWGYGVDAPQRFGDKPYWQFDWGDTEIRYTWHTLTLGFGTQSPWLGPAKINPLLHSNNAPSYPKFDMGMRKQKIEIPKLGWDLGYIEGRLWIGYLSESKYFDYNPNNDHNMINVFTIGYSPSIIPGLSLGMTKVCLSKWNDNSWKYLNPFYNSNDFEDQKMSVTADLVSPKGGLEAYMEIGLDDTINKAGKTTPSALITHFWHTLTYTFGAKAAFDIPKSEILKGELLFEWNNTEMSQDFQFNWPYNFGFHHQISQGYTNRGQWLGSGIGYGGNAQYLHFKMYNPKGSDLVYIYHYQPDNNYLFCEAIYDVSTGEEGALHKRTWNFFKGELAIGTNHTHFITNDFQLSGSLTYVRIVNPIYNKAEKKYQSVNNFVFELSAKYNF